MQDAESFIAAAQGMKNVVVTEIKSAQIVERNGALNLGDVFAQEQAIPVIAKMMKLMAKSRHTSCQRIAATQS